MNVDHLKEIAQNRVKEPIVDSNSLERFLKRWWCMRYNRPFKDPLLNEYTVEELVLEFYEIQLANSTDATVDSKSEKEDEEWLKKQMGKEYIDPEEKEIEEELEDEEWFEKYLGEHYINNKESELPDLDMTF